MADLPQKLSLAQQRAADPALHPWVLASAGSGKTQVLTARVLRLLLAGARPDSLLCLTFTKAAAAEMSNRVLDRLVHWATAGDAAIMVELTALGIEPVLPDQVATARGLFAQVLDLDGGLPIMTVHALAQSLLARFPVEAGLAPGFKTQDERQQRLAANDALERTIEAILTGRDAALAADLEAMAVAVHEGGFRDLLAAFMQKKSAIDALICAGEAALLPKLRRALGLPTTGDARTLMVAQLSAPALDEAGLRQIALRWGAAVKFADRADRLGRWLALAAPARVDALEDLLGLFFNKDRDALLAQRTLAPKSSFGDDFYDEVLAAVAGVQRALDVSKLLEVCDRTAAMLRLCHRVFTASAEAKRTSGEIDFDDMIERAADLLADRGVRDWVRYKLGAHIAHVLVDEGQDTNASQWRIIDALTEEFFTGDSSATMFAVGDVKQSIYGFQGADPESFLAARDRYARALERIGGRQEPVPLDVSYRSAQAVLDVVDAWLGRQGPDALGLDAAALPHVAHRSQAAGRVTLWPPLDPAPKAKGGEWHPTDEMDWQPSGERRMAAAIASQVNRWVRDGAWLEAKGRPMRWGDVLVLVRSRGEFAGALVAEFKSLDAPVSGIDRMSLQQPAAIAYLLALLRFVLTPRDDLSLATVLVSPLVGLTDEELFALAHGREEAPLIAMLQATDDARFARARAFIAAVLSLAARESPFSFLEAVLSGLGGLRRLIARLGDEARDPVDVLLGQALAYERDGAPSLQGFLGWVEAADVDVKRDPDSAGADAVRIMTVHGAKGLQAPVVILADAARDRRKDDVFVLMEVGGVPDVPVWHGKKSHLIGPVAEARSQAEAKAAREDKRLLYVAMTRAEDQLYVGGWIPDNRSELPKGCWLEQVTEALEGMADHQMMSDPDWGDCLQLASGAPAPRSAPDVPAIAIAPALPAWAHGLAPGEPAPPRPLAPSQLAEEPGADSPRSARRADALRRGVLIHTLLQHLPGIAAEQRRHRASQWLGRQAPDLEGPVREQLGDEVMRLLDDPALSAVFGEGSLAEAPISGVLGQNVISGVVDRLAILPDRVLVVDYKTGLAVPASVEATPLAYLKQMAAYQRLLESIYPDRPVTAALVWTAAARLMVLPDALLRAHRIGG